VRYRPGFGRRAMNLHQRVLPTMALQVLYSQKPPSTAPITHTSTTPGHQVDGHLERGKFLGLGR
jgi:hypothetical protein